MPTSAQINLQSGVALDDLERERVREIVLIAGGSGSLPASDLNDRINALSAAQNKATRADIAAWDAVFDGTVKKKGGDSGIDFDPVRDREAIRQRVRLRLGLPAVDPGVAVGKSALVPFKITTGWRGRRCKGEY